MRITRFIEDNKVIEKIFQHHLQWLSKTKIYPVRPVFTCFQAVPDT